MDSSITSEVKCVKMCGIWNCFSTCRVLRTFVMIFVTSVDGCVYCCGGFFCVCGAEVAFSFGFSCFSDEDCFAFSRLGSAFKNKDCSSPWGFSAAFCCCSGCC